MASKRMNKFSPEVRERAVRMVEAAKVACLSQDRQCVDRTDTRDIAQQLVIEMLCKPGMGEPFDLIALVDEAATLRNDHAKHGDRDRVLGHRQRRRTAGGLVHVVDQPGLGARRRLRWPIERRL